MIIIYAFLCFFMFFFINGNFKNSSRHDNFLVFLTRGIAIYYYYALIFKYNMLDILENNMYINCSHLLMLVFILGF